MTLALLMRACPAQVAVHLMVEQSRRACSAVANGDADCAIIGGDVPDELAHVLKVGSACNLAIAAMLTIGGLLLHSNPAWSDVDELSALRASVHVQPAFASSVSESLS